MQYLGLALLVAGLIAMFVAGVGMIIAAFRKGLLWGLAYLLVPFAAVVFIAQHWEDTKRHFFLWLKGVAVVVAGYGVVFLFAPASAQSSPTPPTPPLTSTAHLPAAAPPTPLPTPLPLPTIAPPSTAPPSSSDYAVAATGPDVVGLRIYFRNPFSDGRVIVHADSTQIFQRVLNVPKAQAAFPIDDYVQMRPEVSQLKIWVISTDRTTNFYRVVPVSYSGGQLHTLELELQPAGLSFALH